MAYSLTPLGRTALRRSKTAYPRLTRCESGFRFFSPGTGRWVTRDMQPTDVALLYGFQRNSPMRPSRVPVPRYRQATGFGTGLGALYSAHWAEVGNLGPRGKDAETVCDVGKKQVRGRVSPERCESAHLKLQRRRWPRDICRANGGG